MNDEPAGRSRDLLQGEAIHGQWESDYLNPDIDQFYDLAFDDILKRLKPTPASEILDAGCGYCYHTVRLARSGAKITAADFSEVALRAARETIDRAGLQGRVTLCQADLTSLFFQDASFDYVVSWGVLMHIPQLEKALSELSRVLRPGGILVLSENNMHALDVTIRETLINMFKAVLGRAGDKVAHTQRGIEVEKKTADGVLMVRKTDMDFLSSFLKSMGLSQIARTAGQFTEAYTNVPIRPLKRLVYALNSFYFKRSMDPRWALGNIVYFRKDDVPA